MTEQPLRVMFCTNGGLHGALVLNRLLSTPRLHVCGIVYSTRMMRASDGFIRGVAAYLKRCGVPYTLYLWCATSLSELLLRFSPLPSVTARAAGNNIPLRTTRQINETATKAFIKNAEADLLISAFFNQRIDEEVTVLPKLGAINIHPGLLPDFRGVDPAFFAMLCGASLGVSVHRIAPEFDTGAIIAGERLNGNSGDSVWWNTARAFDRGGELLVASLDEIMSGAKGRAQGNGGRYDSWPTPEQVRTLSRRGEKLVGLRELWKLLRHPFPTPAESTNKKKI